MNAILKSGRTRPIRKTVPARLLRVGLAVSAAISAFRAEASLAKTPCRIDTLQPGWLGAGDRDPGHHSVAPARSRRELFFIDAAVADPGAFWLAAPADATVVCIPIGVDSWEFMAREAGQFRGLGAIHVISHGTPGALTLNGRRYTAADLGTRALALRALGGALTKNGDILLYGCDTGEGVAGAKFVTRLAEFTGADVAASSNPTGGLSGADWNLEIAGGEIETAPLAPRGYEHELATLTVTTGLDTGADVTFGANQAADLADGGGLSLREAIQWASNGDTINFNIGMAIALSTIDSGDSLLLINKNLTLDGDLDDNGTADVTLDGQYKGRVLEIAVGSTVVLDGLIVTRGLVAARGGGLSIAGTALLKNTAVIGNAASGGGGGGTLNNNFTANITPAFVDAGSATLNINQNAGATDIRGLLHVSDTDSSQTETWLQNSPPSHGTLSIVGATAASGSTNIIPGGTITYAPTNGFAGSDSFVMQASDGTATATRTVATNTVVFAVTFSEDVTGVVPSYFVLTPVNGSTMTGTIGSITGGPRIYDVSVNLTGGLGEFRLDVIAP